MDCSRGTFGRQAYSILVFLLWNAQLLRVCPFVRSGFESHPPRKAILLLFSNVRDSLRRTTTRHRARKELHVTKVILLSNRVFLNCLLAPRFVIDVTAPTKKMQKDGYRETVHQPGLIPYLKNDRVWAWASPKRQASGNFEINGGRKGDHHSRDPKGHGAVRIKLVLP